MHIHLQMFTLNKTWNFLIGPKMGYINEEAVSPWTMQFRCTWEATCSLQDYPFMDGRVTCSNTKEVNQQGRHKRSFLGFHCNMYRLGFHCNMCRLWHLCYCYPLDWHCPNFMFNVTMHSRESFGKYSTSVPMAVQVWVSNKMAKSVHRPKCSWGSSSATRNRAAVNPHTSPCGEQHQPREFPQECTTGQPTAGEHWGGQMFPPDNKAHRNPEMQPMFCTTGSAQPTVRYQEYLKMLQDTMVIRKW